MPKWRERTCTGCKSVMTTASKSDVCITCSGKSKALSAVDKEKKIIDDYGYGIVGEPTKNHFGKRVYKLVAPCCDGEFSTVFGNLMSGIKKNEQSGYNKLPCGLCGPKHRMTSALAGYIEKNGVDYDLATFKQYKRKVHGLSDITYEENKQTLNPTNEVRGLAGLDGVYHLDHKVPIIQAFKEGWSPERCAEISNLQMLPWSENLSKGSRA